MAQKSGKQQNTAYGVFVQACWAQHKRQYPNEMIHKEIEEFNKQCSVCWYNLSEQEREHGEDKGKYLRYMKVQTLADGSKVRTILDPDDPILDEYEINKRDLAGKLENNMKVTFHAPKSRMDQIHREERFQEMADRSNAQQALQQSYTHVNTNNANPSIVQPSAVKAKLTEEAFDSMQTQISLTMEKVQNSRLDQHMRHLLTLSIDQCKTMLEIMQRHKKHLDHRRLGNFRDKLEEMEKTFYEIKRSDDVLQELEVSTKANAEEYDIEKVLQELQELEVSTKGEKPKRKRKKKSKKKKSTAAGAEAVEVIEGIEIIEATEVIEASEVIEATEVSTPTESNEAKIDISKPVQNPDQQFVQTEPRIPECSTCFEPRTRTFLLLPCGHATFCQACTEHFCNSDNKRCPTCQTNITGKVRVFQ